VVEKIGWSKKEDCHSGTARRAGPGIHEHLFLPICWWLVFMVSGFAGDARAPE
jgi:hypothetical protein